MKNSKKIIDLKNIPTNLMNKKIVLAHGVFDIFHLGHKKHLEIAKSNGDILVVSITSDRYVKKGPSRPIFNENHRAELLSAINFIDFVIINDDETPINLIKKLKPSFYIKGNDYKNLRKDITGNIYKEKKAVENGGGKLIFTDEIQFSSSRIINETFTPQKILKNFKDLDKFRQESLTAIQNLSDLKVFVLGEIIFDKYISVTELDKPGKENIQSVKYDSEQTFVGGSFPIAKFLSTFVKNVEISCIGNFNSEQKKLIHRKIIGSKNLKCKIYQDKFQTITKKRYIDKKNKKLFEEYLLDGVSKFSDKNNLSFLNKLDKYDLVILADFGHGLINKKIVNILNKKTKFLCINAQTNSENRGFNLITKYKKADYICIDKLEANLALAEKEISTSEQIRRLYKSIKTKFLTISLGSDGIEISHKKGNKIESVNLPAFEIKPIDTLGAGDAVFAISSALLKKEKI